MPHPHFSARFLWDWHILIRSENYSLVRLGLHTLQLNGFHSRAGNWHPGCGVASLHTVILCGCLCTGHKVCTSSKWLPLASDDGIGVAEWSILSGIIYYLLNIHLYSLGSNPKNFGHLFCFLFVRLFSSNMEKFHGPGIQSIKVTFVIISES